jgi:Flp pilus assembly protein TadG
MRRCLQRLAGDERGGALAEFALGLIPLILAFALIFEVGRAFWIHQAAIKGVRDATRYLTRVEDPSNAPPRMWRGG